VPFIRKVLHNFISIPTISAKIGGWFSLAIGASMVSFLEIIYISLALVIKLIKRKFRKRARYVCI
jgi:hypothetical protein